MAQVQSISSNTDTQDKKAQSATAVANSNKNDWKIETDSRTTSDDKTNGCSLSFIHVIIIRRILVNNMTQSIHSNDDSDEYIKRLVSEIKDLDNDSMKSKACETLSQLITKDGIKSYFNSWKEKDNNSHIIDIIFNKLILTKFINEYGNIIRYKSKDSKDKQLYYQDLVFNMKDLMCSIFEFLDYDIYMKGDLLNCGLTCSHWLYHVYNTPLWKILAIDTLVRKTLSYHDEKKNNENKNDKSGLRMWSRLTKLHSFDFVYFYGVKKPPSQLLLNKVSLLKNIKKLNGVCKIQHLALLKTIIGQCREKIEHYSLHMDYGLKEENNVLSPLILPNALYVEISSLYFYIVWSNKCQTLTFWMVRNIDKKWCHFVIKNCDCSNIKCLNVDGKTFLEEDFITNNKYEDEEAKKLLKQFAQRFVNLKDFTIQLSYEFDEVLSLFCKYLKPIIDKNNVAIKLVSNDEDFPAAEFDKAFKCIEESNIGSKIYKLSFNLDGTTKQMNSIFNSIKKDFIANVEWIELSNWDSNYNVLIVNYMNQMVFESLKVFKYVDIDMQSEEYMGQLNKILEMAFDKLTKSQLYIIVDFSPDFVDVSCLEKEFTVFCQKIFNLMIKHEIAIKISLKLYGVSEQSKHDQLDNIYHLYFNQETILKDYKQPQCNKYCVPLTIPKMLFTWNSEKRTSKMLVMSAELIKKQ